MRIFTRFAGLAVLVGLWGGRMAAAQDLIDYDPIADISGEMQTVVGHLAKLTTHQPTQDSQKEVVRKLDVLIEELEKQCENCRGNRSGANPTKPLADSIIKSGPGGSGKLHAARPDGKQWGELPPHERDRILQSLTEGFPAHYQTILERYYKRLAEEKTTPSDEAAAPADKDGNEPAPKDGDAPAPKADKTVPTSAVPKNAGAAK